MGCRQLVTPASQDRCFFREMSLPVPGPEAQEQRASCLRCHALPRGFSGESSLCLRHGAVVRVCDDGKAPQMDTVCRWALWVTLLVFRKSCQLGARHVGEGPFLWPGGPG